MLKKKVPAQLLDYGLNWVCETENICANLSKYAKGRAPIEIITGNTPDISEYLDFNFYNWIVFRSNAGLGEAELGKWLGVSHRVGRLMSYWILPPSGIPVSVTTVQRVTNDEKNTDEMRDRMRRYDEKLVFETQSADLARDLRNVDSSKVIDAHNEDPNFYAKFTRVISDAALRPMDDDANIDVTSDQYVGLKLALSSGGDGETLLARVNERVRDEEGNPVGNANDNPLLDSRKYEFKYADRHVKELTANIIAENIIAQVDEEGRRQMMMSEIEDHRVLPDAVPKAQGTYVNQYGVKRRKSTTRGWGLLVEWKDGSTDWVALQDLKESYPVELARYAMY
jgi:hypothetical protein